jgi:hypothetical protein
MKIPMSKTSATRIGTALLVLSMTTTSYAQETGSTSGASSSINMSSPAYTSSSNRLYTPPSVVAPGLTAAGVETCLGSTSGGVSVMGGGFTFGRTVVDNGCSIRLLARQLFAFGFQKAAMAVMCQDERVAAAMLDVGTPCPAAFAETSERSQFSAVQSKPFTSDEQAWFERASN